MKPVTGLMAAVLLLLVAVPVVAAHAQLVSRTPRPGSTVPTGPIEIIARFNEALDTDRSSINVRDASGEIAARGAVDGRDLRIGLEGLLPGEYEVRWQAAGADGHLERGTWQFTVAEPPSPSPTASPPPSDEPPPSEAPSPTPSESPSSEPSPEPSPSPDPGASASGGDVVIPIVAALVIVIAGLAALLLRSRRSV